MVGAGAAAGMPALGADGRGADPAGVPASNVQESSEGEEQSGISADSAEVRAASETCELLFAVAMATFAFDRMS